LDRRTIATQLSERDAIGNAGRPHLKQIADHRLAPESGGEAFHSGGRQFASQNDPDFFKMAEWVKGLNRSNATAEARKVRIYVNNSAGNTVDVIDPATNKTVQTIYGVELPHGVVFSAVPRFNTMVVR
jgi:YVTN family beta-propeller protein